ncbi:MAG: acyl-CoA dehydrogenase family protein [Aestuariivita sp.]|nr:acyl-CoA dehydrogenase family protein [Aestuariivita sp.]MCY4202179.1 acyl-CoA dehydrogenase family protein [Aestuariivita sp.]MCY4289810.1 acyl-CoA dehydrogenase family protein [Aestuariivita sp.]MCY4347438.1 acyl-CoA dehydrogenase family protein [Aestuariivita sp.]
MEFALTEDQDAVFDMVCAFSEAEIGPYAQRWEEDGTIPRSLWPKAGDLGLGGIYVSETNGGTGLSRLDATLIFEAMSMACPSVSAFLSIHNMCADILATYAHSDLQNQILNEVISLKRIISYCLTEPGSGSDAAALATRAERTDGGYILNGTKAFISGASYSDGYIVMVRTGQEGAKGISAIFVDKDAKGISFGALERKMGWQAQPTAQVQFDNCFVPSEHLIGVENQGFHYAMAGLDGGRLNIAACSLGAAQAAMNKTIDYMQERKAFGKSLDQFESLQFRLADLEIDLQAARVFLRQAAWKFDQQEPDASKHCAMAKKFVTEIGSKVVDQCLQLHGGYGYLTDYGIEKLVRDLRVHQILEGTNEIMRIITARHLLSNQQ